ncbi:hypothetical protein ABZU42_01045 [Micromonospora profundi]|uniref:hypothetical protein n=1 Tax=Micromonospora profundi TaxID=1420889 RepID=UPI0033B5B327
MMIQPALTDFVLVWGDRPLVTASCVRGRSGPLRGGTENLAWLKRLLPGGAATELTMNAWNGGVAVIDSLLLLAPTLAWVAVAVTLATRLFRWEPRR